MPENGYDGRGGYGETANRSSAKKGGKSRSERDSEEAEKQFHDNTHSKKGGKADSGMHQHKNNPTNSYDPKDNYERGYDKDKARADNEIHGRSDITDRGSDTAESIVGYAGKLNKATLRYFAQKGLGLATGPDTVVGKAIAATNLVFTTMKSAVDGQFDTKEAITIGYGIAEIFGRKLSYASDVSGLIAQAGTERGIDSFDVARTAVGISVRVIGGGMGAQVGGIYGAAAGQEIAYEAATRTFDSTANADYYRAGLNGEPSAYEIDLKEPTPAASTREEFESAFENARSWEEVFDQFPIESIDGSISYTESLRPILLDLDDNGIQITDLTKSTMFVDATGDGLQNRTAWAGAGDGVLFYDPDNLGEITEKRQYVFTEWDPTATSDMEALASYFDSNGDGVLDASDAEFANFKVLVTNADGSTTAKTLTELGITEINLTADATHIELPDGSMITEQTTFAHSGGTTGTDAGTTLMAEAA